MNNDFPIPITRQHDLDYYENYLDNEFSMVEKQETRLSQFLKTYIGKPIKIDYAIGNKSEARMGVLSSVGDDFLVIKSQNQNDIIIPLASVKSLTVLQNNTKLPHF